MRSLMAREGRFWTVFSSARAGLEVSRRYIENRHSRWLTDPAGVTRVAPLGRLEN
jgi:hypothetical protein